MAKAEAVRKKKKGKAIKVLIPVFLVLIVAGFLTVSFLYNLFSIRDTFFSAVYSMDPEFQSFDAIQIELSQKEAELSERESKVTAQEEKLDELKAKLDERADELDRQELESQPIYLRPMTEEELGNMKSISKVYSEMQPQDAAGILASLSSVDDMAAVLYYMPEESSAAILSVMDTELAVQITDTLLHY